MNVQRKELALALRAVGKAVNKRAQLPALGGVKITAADGVVTLEGTDLELNVRATLPGSGEGSVVLPFALLNDLVRADKADTVTFDDGTEKRIGERRFTVNGTSLRTLPMEDFPTLPEVGESVFLGDLPLGTILGVTAASSKDEARPVLTGVLVEWGKGEVAFVATDSYRLHVARFHDADDDPLVVGKRIVPARAFAAISVLGKDISVGVYVETNRVALTAVKGAVQVTLTSRIIEGDYPQWTSLIPPELPNTVAFDVSSFVSSLRSVALMAQSGTPVKIDLNGKVVLSAGSQDVGDTEQEVDGVYEGEPMRAGFNPQYWLDALASSIGSERAVMGMRDGLKPALIWEAGREPWMGPSAQDPEMRYGLIMPVRCA